MNTTDTTTTAPIAGFSLAALATAAAIIAPTTRKGKGMIQRLGAIGNGAIALYIRLADSDCKMDARGRVRVALRALPECPAKDATHTLGALVEWAALPDAVRAGAIAENGDTLTPCATGETAYYCTIVPRA